MATKKGGLGRGLESLLGDLQPKSISIFEDTSAGKAAEKEQRAKKGGGAEKYTEKSTKRGAAVEKRSSNVKKSSKNEAERGNKAENTMKSASVHKAVEKVQKAADAFAEGVIYISLDDIKPNSKQPRHKFNEEALTELAGSIKDNGVIQPILVRSSKAGYELVAGERRWRAARKAGLKKIPAIVRELSDRQNALIALLENMQREDLNMIEEAQGIDSLMKDYGLSQEEAAKAVGKSRPYISNALRLLRLPEELRDMVENGELSAGHAKVIAGLSGEALQISLAKRAVKEGWSVRKLEVFAGTKKSGGSKKKQQRDAAFKDVEEKLSQKIGTKVRINGSENRGRIELEYYSRAELDRLIELLSDEYRID